MKKFEQKGPLRKRDILIAFLILSLMWIGYFVLTALRIRAAFWIYLAVSSVCAVAWVALNYATLGITLSELPPEGRSPEDWAVFCERARTRRLKTRWILTLAIAAFGALVLDALDLFLIEGFFDKT